MDLLIKQRERGKTQEERGKQIELHAHITDKNEVFALEGFTYNLDTGRYTDFKPDIVGMISTVRDIRAQFDIDPYEKPIRPIL
jgi:hypothetical protein